MGYKLQKADLFSESAVYGLVMVSALLLVTNQYEVTSREVFIKVLGTVVVFWLAHAFATAVSHMGVVADAKSPFRESFRYAFAHSAGLLIAAVVPLAIVLLGVVNLISDDVALWTALWVDAVLLGLLGYFSSGAWTRNTSLRLRVGARDRIVGRVHRFAQGIHSLGRPQLSASGRGGLRVRPAIGNRSSRRRIWRLTARSRGLQWFGHNARRSPHWPQWRSPGAPPTPIAANPHRIPATEVGGVATALNGDGDPA